MSKKCPECGGTNTSKDWYAHDQGICYVCNDCCFVGESEEFKELTVFDRITESVEVLAEKLVYPSENFKVREWDAEKEEWTEPHGFWRSTLIPDLDFDTKPEAIAATVAELEKEYKEDDSGRN